MRLSEVLKEEPAVVAATGMSPSGQPPAVGQGPSPAQAAQMQAQATQDQMKKKQDLQHAIKDKEQELISLRKELATLNSSASVA